MIMTILTEVTVIMVMVNYDYILNTVSYDKQKCKHGRWFSSD